MDLDEKTFFQIPNFENYVISKDSFEVKNLKTGKQLRPIKSKALKKFRLSKDGQYHILTLWQILHRIFSNKTRS